MQKQYHAPVHEVIERDYPTRLVHVICGITTCCREHPLQLPSQQCDVVATTMITAPTTASTMGCITELKMTCGVSTQHTRKQAIGKSRID